MGEESEVRGGLVGEWRVNREREVQEGEGEEAKEEMEGSERESHRRGITRE